MNNDHSSKKYDLEERTFRFAKDVCQFTKKLNKTVSNIEYIRQVIKSSGSVGANYIEANESLGKKDFKMRIRISRKESKESTYWLRLIPETNESEIKAEALSLHTEAIELKKIFSTILIKSN
jgi:four helix bundle protein